MPSNMSTLRILRRKLLAWLRLCVCVCVCVCEVVSDGLGRIGKYLDLRSLCFRCCVGKMKDECNVTLAQWIIGTRRFKVIFKDR